MEEKLSKLRIYSLGVVAINKPLDSNVIEVTPIEDLPMVNGEITDTKENYKSKGEDSGGSSYQTDIDSTATIKATWMPIGCPNRYTSPDVRRGEMVQIYRFADSDKYYWVTYKDDLTLRKLETVIYAFSGTTGESDGVSEETHYFLEVSTHAKLVHFHTSKANGEPFSYDIQINTKDGCIVIQDDVGNVFSMDSKQKRIELQNSDTTHLDMDKKDFTITVPGNTTINTTGNTEVNTKGNTKVISKGDTLIDSGGSTTITSSGSVAISSKSGNASMDSSGSMNIKAPTMTLDGVVTIKKLITPNEISCPRITGVASGLG